MRRECCCCGADDAGVYLEKYTRQGGESESVNGFVFDVSETPWGVDFFLIGGQMSTTT